MILKSRLEAILKATDNTNTLLDAGCDHAYLAIEAIKRGCAKKVIASDINEGPLKKAEENIKKAGLMGEIDIRLGSGIEVISENEADTVVIAGMGGILITEILDKNPALSKSVSAYILQPMNSKEDLRRYLINNGYTIDYEILAEERGKIYSILKVLNKKQPPYEKEIFYHIGNLLRVRHADKELILKYIGNTARKFTKIKESLKSAQTDNTKQAYYIDMLLEELIWLKSEMLKK